MIAHPRIRCLSLGDPTCGELRRCASLIESRASTIRLDGVRTACEWLAMEKEFVDWIVLWQPHPGRWRQDDVDRLRAAAPLARMLQVAGVASEGEPASGQRLHGVVRIGWHEFATRLEDTFRRARLGMCTEWDLPLTATRVDHALWVSTAAESQAARWHGRTVHVIAETSLDFEAVAGWCRAMGATVLRGDVREIGGLGANAVVIWNLGCSRKFERGGRAIPRIELHTAVVLIDFPRPAEVFRWEQHGWRVLARPFRSSELLAVVR